MGANVHPESTGTAVPSRFVADTAQDCDDWVLRRCWAPREDARHDAPARGIDRTARPAGMPGVRAGAGAGGRTPVRGVRAGAAVAARGLSAVRAAQAPWPPLFRGALVVADLMAAHIAANLPPGLRDPAVALVPVPAARARRRARGFDPARV